MKKQIILLFVMAAFAVGLIALGAVMLTMEPSHRAVLTPDYAGFYLSRAFFAMFAWTMALGIGASINAHIKEYDY